MTLVNTETGEVLDTINYDVHPVAACFPYIEGEAFREFVEDIRVNGQREPVMLGADGRLLDGRNRVRACQALGIDVLEERYEGDDVEAWIISHNIHRRHLTESQRAMIAARRANLRPGRPKLETAPIGEVSPISHSGAAQALNVGTSSVTRAKVVLNSGDPDLIKSVESGEMTVSKAERQIRVKAKAEQGRPPAPPKYGGGRRKHLGVIEAMNHSLSGYAMAAKDITVLDQSVTKEEAARLKSDLSEHIKSLNTLKNLLWERTK